MKKHYVFLTAIIFISVDLFCQVRFITIKKQPSGSPWVYEQSEFNTSVGEYHIVDHDLSVYAKSVYNNVYFDQKYDLGLIINTNGLEFIQIFINGIYIDPFRLPDREYDGSVYVVNISRTILGHLTQVYKNKFLSDPDGIEAKVNSEAKGYLMPGGQIELQIKYKNNTDLFYYRLIPEKYRFTLFNEALPINAQYSKSIISDNQQISNLLNLYYPFQYVIKSKNREGFNLTSITKRISFGPALLASVGEEVKIQGGGAMLGLGLSPNGLPILGIGYGFTRQDNFLMFTINPVEVIRIIFNPREIFEN